MSRFVGYTATGLGGAIDTKPCNLAALLVSCFSRFMGGIGAGSVWRGFSLAAKLPAPNQQNFEGREAPAPPPPPTPARPSLLSGSGKLVLSSSRLFPCL